MTDLAKTLIAKVGGFTTLRVRGSIPSDESLEVISIPPPWNIVARSRSPDAKDQGEKREYTAGEGEPNGTVGKSLVDRLTQGQVGVLKDDNLKLGRARAGILNAGEHVLHYGRLLVMTMGRKTRGKRRQLVLHVF